MGSWASAIKGISQVYLSKGDYVAAAGHCAGELYGYGHSNVLFKPTKAKAFPFRPTANEAMSYFVGGKAVDKGYDEDAGFAINGGKGWSDAVFDISKVHAAKGDYVKKAGEYARALYGYGFSNVLFKPTKAKAHPFRPTANEAMSYFVGGNAVDNGYDEDAGFAINGGKGWKAVKFDNHQIDINGNTAIAMGEYTFTCASTGALVKVEYTFGYKQCPDGKIRIFLHHSSVPYNP